MSAAAPAIRKGQRVTCVRGHYIATMARDLSRGTVRADHFEDVQGPRIMNGDKDAGIAGTLLGRCVCGARFVAGGAFHIEGAGWQPFQPTREQIAAPFPDGMPAFGRIDK